MAWGSRFVPAMGIFLLFLVPLLFSYLNTVWATSSILLEFPSMTDFADGNIMVNYLMTNDTERAINVGEFRVMAISSDARLYSPHDGLDLCSEPKLIDARDVDSQAFPTGAPPITISYPEFDVITYPTPITTVDGTATQQKNITIEAHKGIQISTLAKISMEGYKKHNTMTVCPSFKLFGSSYGRREITCKGSSRIVFPSSEYADRTSMLTDHNFTAATLRSDSRGFGVIYLWVSKTLFVTDDPKRGSCS